MDNKGPVRVLAIAGHSPRESSGRALLGAVGRLAADTGTEVSIYRELETLPLFSQDLDGEHAPAAVVRLRAAVRASDAVLISSPEYVHGGKGAIRNALDWVDSSGELVDKPIALINASHAKRAWASLTETSAVSSAHVVLEAWVTVPLDDREVDGNHIAGNAALSNALTSAIVALALAAPYVQGFQDAGPHPHAQGAGEATPCGDPSLQQITRDIRDPAGCDVDTPGKSQTW
jgi:chromate reductase, NAD(P)H dehydrogenase (quinone)